MKLKRCFDFIVSMILLIVLTIPILFVAVLVKITSRGPVLYWSSRVGKDNIIFQMPKFRSMQTYTPALATHLLTDSAEYLTPIGGFLRKTSLDELPQLWCVLKGEMSLVGPRPALFNQDDLIHLRTEKGIHKLIPGLTGWAQINGRDELAIPEKVALDEDYLSRQSLWFDMNILLKTFRRILWDESVSH